MSDTSKSRLGKYELLEEIGDGAEGRIFKARCIEAGVPGVAVGDFVALKRLRQTGSETQSDIFKRTTEILRALNHPNIVRYKDSFEGTDEALDEPVYCLVTELLEGETLKELMDKNKTGLPWDKAQKIVIETLQALEHAGNKTVVHRDLKLSNIYFTHQGDVKIIDFGIAKHEDSGATASSGGLLGSWDYMACDFVLMSQESNFRGDQQSDVFSFGVCLYQLLTGALPYPPLGGNAQIAYFQRYMALDKLPKVKYTHPIFSILRGARACVEKCLVVDRAVRFKTFSEVLAAIQLIQRRTLQHDEEKYEYLEYIGKGGFGKVYRARRVRDQFEVAIKEVLADKNASRFVREAKMLKITQHPHLVRYMDFVEVSERGMGEERRLFLVLEYLDGMPQSGLSYRIKTSPGGMDPVEVLRFFDNYLDCLEYLHQNTIIHRDIKPGNLYAPAGAPEGARIFDLGIAHDTDGTKTHGQVPGTLDYMPAEFATQGGERGSAQSDIYSMGITLYQALVGKLPFPRLPDDEKMAWTNWYLRCEKPLEVPFEHQVFKAHPELEKLLRGATAHNAADRFTSAKAMRDEIRAILENWQQVIRKQEYEKALAEAQAAFAKKDYPAASTLIRAALEALPEGAEAKELLDKIETEKLRRVQYDTAIATAKKELERKAPDAAVRHIRMALQVWPEGIEAKQLLDRIELERKPRLQYDIAVTAAKRELDRGDIDAAAKQIKTALEVWPEGAEAKQLLERIEGERDRKVQYEAAIAAAREMMDRGDLDDASSKAQLALEALPENAEARQLLDRIETERLRRIQYDTALLAAKSELERDDFDAATRQVKLAMGIWPEGGDAKQLLEEIESERQRRTKYDAAYTAARKALERDDIDTAIQKAQTSLELWPEKAEAKQLLERLESERSRRSNYEAAIADAKETLERGELDDAIRKAKKALEIWPDKVEAKRLLDRAETDKRRIVKYDSAIAAARKALEEEEFETARAQADEALKIKAADPFALELRSQAERGIRESFDDEPATVATMLEAPPDLPKEATSFLERPVVDEPKTLATVSEPPVPEPPTVSTAIKPSHDKPLTEVKTEPEVAPEPVIVQAAPPEEPPAPPPPARPVVPAPAPAPVPLPKAPAPARPPERKEKSKMPLYIGIAAALAVVGGVVVMLTSHKSASPSAPPTATTPAPAQTAPPPPSAQPPAFVLYSADTITKDVADNKATRIACKVRNPQGLRVESSDTNFLPSAKITFQPVGAGETNDSILLQTHAGYTTGTDVTIKDEGSGLSPATATVHVQVTGQPVPPQLEVNTEDRVLEPGGKTDIEFNVSSSYFAPEELKLTKTIDRQDVLKMEPLQRKDNGFALPLVALQTGEVELGLLLKAPNGTSADKRIHIRIKPKAAVASPPRITDLASSMVIGSFGQHVQPIQFTVAGGTTPITFDYRFEPELPRKGTARSESTAAGTRLTLAPPQGASGRANFTAIVSDAAGHQVSSKATVQFLPTNSIGMPLAWIPGLPDCSGQWMELANGGWAGAHEVTQAEFQRVMNNNPSRSRSVGDMNLPVESMTFKDASDFCDALTRLDGDMLAPGWHYALPTEQQWAFFAAGTPAMDTKYAYFAPAGVKKPPAPQEVGKLAANQFGLYDVLGNVAELTSTHWHYSPLDDQTKDFYVCRGGGFDTMSETITPGEPEDKNSWMVTEANRKKGYIGFRVVLISR